MRVVFLINNQMNFLTSSTSRKHKNETEKMNSEPDGLSHASFTEEVRTKLQK